ncbi:MAG: HAD-IB family hydrolase [Actinobacteria bacterium]|nr:HAD-IB family hydrolase [Actinomycetota bacterium]
MTNAAAFFDLDRTLIAGASAFPLGVAAWRQGLAKDAELLAWIQDAVRFRLLGDKGGEGVEDLRSDFLVRIAGVPVEGIKTLEAAVTPNLVSRVRPESRNLIAMHQEHDRDTWIVSASPQPLVEPLAASLGMTGAIGTKGEVIDGHYTGRLEGPFVYGPGKAEAIRKLASDRGYDLGLCYAYSDSISDLPMLEAVGHPVAVNPDSELGAVAINRGWPVVIFARRTKRALAVAGVGTGFVVTAVVAYSLGRRHARA